MNMKIVKNYNDHNVDLILEGLSEGKLPFKLSIRLVDLLAQIKHPIANALINSSINGTHSDVTLIDYTDKNDLVSLATSEKILDFLENELEKQPGELLNREFYRYLSDHESIWTKYRNQSKIGKLVKKVYPDKYKDSGEPGFDIESFVNMYKALYDKLFTQKQILELVEGDDIVKFYDSYSYSDEGDGSPLHNSCMADSDCSEFIRFYAINPHKVKMLVQYEDERKDKITARALVWYLDEPDGRIFMDRIYYISYHQIDIFKNYAKEHGWLYKQKQESGGGYGIVDGKTDEVYDDFLMVVNNINLNRYYPYVDTMVYFYQDEKRLTCLKNGDDYLTLNNTDGAAYDGSWSEYYDMYIYNHADEGYEFVDCTVCVDNISRYNEYGEHGVDRFRRKEDAVYFDFYRGYAPKDQIDKYEFIDTTFGVKYRVLVDDAMYLDIYKEFTTIQYAETYMVYSEYYLAWLLNKDRVKDFFGNDVLMNDCDVVYKDDKLEDYKRVYILKDKLDKYTFKKDDKYILRKEFR